MKNSQMVKIKLSGLWYREDRNGQQYLGASVSDTSSLIVFKEKKYSDNSPDYAAFLRSTGNNNGGGNCGNKTERVKLAALWKREDEDGSIYLWGKTSQGCYLRIEKQDTNGGDERSPSYIAYFCGYDNGNGFLSGDSTGAVSGSSSIRSAGSDNIIGKNYSETTTKANGNHDDDEVLDYDMYMDESHGFTEDEIIF